MVKSLAMPAASPYARSRRCAVAWNVPPCTRPVEPPTRRTARSNISCAARRVNVSRRIRCGLTPLATRCATRCTSVRVLPVPAPAMIRSGRHHVGRQPAAQRSAVVDGTRETLRTGGSRFPVRYLLFGLVPVPIDCNLVHIHAAVALLAPWVAVHVVAVLLPEARHVEVEKLEAAHPFGALPEIQMRHEQAKGPPMLRHQIDVIMPEREQILRAIEVGQGKVGGVLRVRVHDNEGGFGLRTRAAQNLLNGDSFEAIA